MTRTKQQPLCRSFNKRFDLFALVSADPQRYPFLLESTAQQLSQQGKTACFDILMCFPQQTLRMTSQNNLQLDDDGYTSTGFLSALDQLWREHAQDAANLPDLPFSGGWFVYLGYELAGEIEPSLRLPASDSQFPLAQATRIPAAIIYDHGNHQTTIVVEAGYFALLDKIEQDLLTHTLGVAEQQENVCPGLSEENPAAYLHNTQQVLDYIRDGDVFQVNLSREWQGAVTDDAMAFPLYQRLRQSNPAPFAGFAALAKGAIVSSSPERLLRVRGRHIETRPIAGTRPRMASAQADISIQAELIQHPKERAEHVMLIDLERNDLGRICVPGSVTVDEMMVIESYAHVHHIVSNVCGELREATTPGEIIAAVFPGGTITGCPKVRCMEIIAELEAAPRGPYTGSFGYLNHNGDMDLNILIRTISIEQQVLRFRTGAGLVADSNPQHELAETRAKAKGLLVAISGQTNDVATKLPN